MRKTFNTQDPEWYTKCSTLEHTFAVSGSANDGMLAYTRWDYVDCRCFQAQRRGEAVHPVLE